MLLADGAKKTKHIHRHRVKQLVSSKFAKWRGNCVGNRRALLVHDHERCVHVRVRVRVGVRVRVRLRLRALVRVHAHVRLSVRVRVRVCVCVCVCDPK